ncbi:MAG TPA: hypothetical protein EYP67_07050 [Methanosarcinales archaeon]|nr:hypothetical protein [Methanosarcinales archaeon]
MPSVIEGKRMGMVFNMAYGIQGESRYTHLPAMLEMLGIPYVGSGPERRSLALDKVITKRVMQKHGIPTPDFWVYSTGDEDMSDVSYSVIVKPKMEAVFYGIGILEEHRWSSSDICAVRQDRARIDGLGPIGDAPHGCTTCAAYE